ncbi:KpsF/GutQ family sugar-phosphate isomerase [Zavarzinia compransoris]|uniref:KpsF/GutQ family sugar-phosphate isomerase n=1 Tax=Zavarzinia compransoris TaxID=1264899 RepID=A0A317EAE8_9PROT|nr:KpsF/GutQ family sugar-phosphate isomerase [Zavarzinia compransoris]PWR22155.1 KpsF/GutQ family sugar-phosphate isomerase [Zavarzinia compransoris]TDP47094.1 arabinose-5-phosphate isomerase [Zavarzinia compransoris]
MNPVDSDLTEARRVLSTEVAGLNLLAESLDGRFSAAVGRIAEAAGRVIVSGMGKSGLVGKKISATLASTGTPAIFVHPAEASHGDLGMITPNDVVICLSNSGETHELADIIAYTRRHQITLIAITAGAKSTLAQASDILLALPAGAAEACPLGLAPTTSTTMQLALGDALAVALMARRGFTAEQFKSFHPGGKLGSRLIRVGDLMHTGDEVPLAPADARMEQVILTITSKRFGCAGIVDSAGHLVGAITDGDLRRKMGPDLLNMPARDVMTQGPRTTRANALAAEALFLMNKHAITALFVADDARKPVGILHIHDLLRAGVA